MTTFYDLLLPEFISNYIVGGANFSTQILHTFCGKELRYSNFDRSINQYTIKNCRLTHAELEEFMAFFLNCKGASVGFLLKDPTDHKATGQQITLNAPGVYPLHKSYRFAERVYMRKISKINHLSLKITGAEGLDLAIDYPNAQLILQQDLQQDVHIALDFEFHVPVRFATDRIESSLSNDGSIILADINLVEVVL